MLDAVGAHHTLDFQFPFHANTSIRLVGLGLFQNSLPGQGSVRNDTDRGGRGGGFLHRAAARLEEPQPQRVGDHKHRAETHRQRSHHGVHLQPEGGVPAPGGDRNADDIVEERPEQVFLDVADGGLAQFDGAGHIQQIVFHQYDIGGFHGHVGTRPDGDTHVRPGQGGGVVDAVAHHGHLAAFLLQAADFPLLVLGQ